MTRCVHSYGKEGAAASSLVARWAAVWRVERSILHWGNVSSQLHLISPGCPRPNSALIVQKSGLKHRSSIHLMAKKFMLIHTCIIEASTHIMPRRKFVKGRPGTPTCNDQRFPWATTIFTGVEILPVRWMSFLRPGIIKQHKNSSYLCASIDALYNAKCPYWDQASLDSTQTSSA